MFPLDVTLFQYKQLNIIGQKHRVQIMTGATKINYCNKLLFSSTLEAWRMEAAWGGSVEVLIVHFNYRLIAHGNIYIYNSVYFCNHFVTMVKAVLFFYIRTKKRKFRGTFSVPSTPSIEAKRYGMRVFHPLGISGIGMVPNAWLSSRSSLPRP